MKNARLGQTFCSGMDFFSLTISVVCHERKYPFKTLINFVQVTAGGDNADYETIRTLDVGTEVTCMHVRFARARLLGLNFTRIVNGEERSDFQSLFEHNTIDGRIDENCVVLIGEALPHSTSKFSVNYGYDFAFVHLWFKGTRCFVECQEGICKARRKRKLQLPRNTRKARERIEQERMCVHVRKIIEEYDYVTRKFPDYFTSDDTDSEEAQDNSAEPIPDVNTADYGLESVRGGVRFDVDAESWDHSALTKAKPALDPMDDELRKSVVRRQRLMTDERYMPEEDAFKGINLVPETIDEHANIIPCSCGVIFQILITFKWSFMVRCMRTCIWSCRFLF